MASKNNSLNSDLILDLFFPKVDELGHLFQRVKIKEELNRSISLPYEREVMYIWLLNIDSFSKNDQNSYFNFLSIDEKHKANSYHFPIDRK